MDELQQARDALRFWMQAVGPAAEVRPAHQKHGSQAITAFAVGDRFVLKNVAGSPGARRIESEYDLLRHLAAWGVPVAVPVLSDGGRIGVPIEERLYLLYPMLPADHALPAADIRQIYARIGAAVARLHKALAAYPRHIESWTMDLLHRLFSEAVPYICRTLAEAQVQEFQHTMELLQDEMAAALENLPAQRIHGDCHGGNYLLYRGEVSGFVDLDHLPIGPRVYDIGYLLADMAKAPFFNNLAHPDWLDHFDAVVSGYDTENPLSRREKDALWSIMLVTQVLFVEWFLRHDAWEPAQKNLEAFYWIYRRRDEITRRISAV